MKQKVTLRRTAGVSHCACPHDTRGVLSVSELRISMWRTAWALGALSLAPGPPLSAACQPIGDDRPAKPLGGVVERPALLEIGRSGGGS